MPDIIPFATSGSRLDASACSPAWLALWSQARCLTDTRRHVVGSVRRAQETHRYGSANRDLLAYYLPLRSSARTRRRAACTTALSDLSRRSCSRYSRTASGCAAFHRSGNNSSSLAVPRSMCVMTLFCKTAGTVPKFFQAGPRSC
jgi:hypothetical protein